MGASLALVPRATVDVVALPHPFSMERVTQALEPGLTLAEIVRRTGIPDGHGARVLIEYAGVIYGPIPAAQWARIRPLPGRRVIVRAVAGGGGSGGDQNKTTRIILQIVILLAAIVIIVASWGTLTWLAAIIITVGFLAVNMLLPPQFPKLGKLSALNNASGRAPESPTLSITGSQNKANAYGPVPKILGQHRVFPLFGAVPFTELVGNDQYLRELFVVGYGPLAITDLKLGETPLGNYEGVEVEVRQGFPDDAPLTLYTQDVAEEALTIALTKDGGPQARVGTQEATELSVDVVFANGLVQFNAAGTQLAVSVEFLVEYRVVGTAPWRIATGGNPFTISDNRLSQARKGLRWTPVDGQNQYEVRVTRLSDDGAAIDPLIHDQSTWSSLRTILTRDPVTMLGLCKIALRIKATDQLNGIVDQFNCIATAILPDWDTATQSWITRETRSAAAAYRAVLQGPGNARAVTDARLHLPSLQQWAEDAAAGGFTYNQVVDFRTTVLEQLRDIAGGARAAFTMIDGRFGVVQDKAQDTPVQHFTPRNSFNFHGSRFFLDPLHAFKVRFINPAANWQQDERIVYNDGYTEANATKFEVLETVGVTDADQAWKIGRYHLAVARLRPETFTLSVDVEGLVCTRGDRVQLTHDVLLIGLGVARLTRTVVDGTGAVTHLYLDADMPMESGKPYVVRVRTRDGVSLTLSLESPGSSQVTTMLTLLSPYSANPAMNPGDLVQFGEAGLESLPCIVKDIECDKDFVVRLTLLPYSPDVYGADQGPIPPYQTFITQPLDLHRTPPAPVIDAVQSDEGVLMRDLDGTLAPRIVLTVRYVANSSIDADRLEVQYRRSDSAGAYTTLPSVAPGADLVSVAPVEQGVAYDVRLRQVSRRGATSAYGSVLGHVVVGKGSPPPDPIGLVLVGSVLSWGYPTPPPDLAGFQIRRGPGSNANWETALQLHGGVVTATTSFTLPPITGTWTLLVRAVDTGGNLSAGAAARLIDFGVGAVHNIVESRDERAEGFPGTREACAVNGLTGDLEADQVPAAFWSNPSAPFWTNPAALFWSSPYQMMRYTWTYVTGAQAGGTTLLLDVATQGESATIEYKRTADADWLPFAGMVAGIDALTSYDFRITIAAAALQGIIQTLTLILDATDLTEAFEDVAIAAPGGTRLSLTKTYRTIKSLQLTVVVSGAETAVAARAVDKDAALGPLVETLDAAGAQTAGHIDCLLTGF